MSNVLIVAEQHGGALRKATLHALAAGRALAARTGGKLHVALLGAGVKALGPELAKHGAEVHVADAPVLDHALAEAHAPVVVALAKATGAAYVGAAATAYGKDLLPRAAALLDAGMATEVLGFGGAGPAVTFRRPMWAGNVLAEVEISTPLERMTVPRISGKKVAVVPILRAGIGMLDGVLSLLTAARVGFIGLYRNEETLQPVEYYVKLPADVAERDVILLDPMLATGNSTAAAVDILNRAGAQSVRMIAIIAAPEGLERLRREVEVGERSPRLGVGREDEDRERERREREGDEQARRCHRARIVVSGMGRSQCDVGVERRPR